MTDIKRIRVPTSLLFFLSFFVILLYPTCPVQDQRMRLPGECPPSGPCAEFAPSTQLDPPILVLTNGLRWEVHSTGDNLTYDHVFTANPVAVAVLFFVPVVPPLLISLREKAEDRRRRVTLTRRWWRAFLWVCGLSMLLSSAYWSWSYVLFYGGMTTTSVVDPLLVSLLATFLLFGIGLSVMMLGVRSRAIWPVRTEREE